MTRSGLSKGQRLCMALRLSCFAWLPKRSTAVTPPRTTEQTEQRWNLSVKLTWSLCLGMIDDWNLKPKGLLKGDCVSEGRASLSKKGVQRKPFKECQHRRVKQPRRRGGEPERVARLCFTEFQRNLPGPTLTRCRLDKETPTGRGVDCDLLVTAKAATLLAKRKIWNDKLFENGAVI